MIDHTKPWPIGEGDANGAYDAIGPLVAALYGDGAAGIFCTAAEAALVSAAPMLYRAALCLVAGHGSLKDLQDAQRAIDIVHPHLHGSGRG